MIEISNEGLSNFADGESIIEISDCGPLVGEHVFVSFAFSFDAPSKKTINDQLLESLLLIHQVKERGAGKITVVAPYLPYARQCKSVEGRFVGPFRAIGSFFKAVGADEVVVCEMHEKECAKMFSIPVKELCFDQLWAETIRSEIGEENLSSLCFLSPDKGGVERAKRLAAIFGVGYASVEKKRVRYDESVAVSLQGEVADKVIVLVDDIVDTGRTATEAAVLAVKNGARSIFACFAHAVFSAGALERIEKSCFEKVWVTDSLRVHRDLSRSKISVLGIKEWMKKTIASTR